MKFSLVLICFCLTIVSCQKISTFNLGLEEIKASERVPFQIQALRQSQSDLICIQELWGGPTELIYFINSMRDLYPYVATYLSPGVNASEFINYDNYPGRVARSDQSSTACTAKDISLDEIKALVNCYISGSSSDNICGTNSGANRFTNDCLLRCAESAFLSLQSTICWNCITEQLYGYHANTEGLLAALTACFTDPAEKWNLTLGLLILSKTPIALRERGLYNTFMIPRGYLLVELLQNLNQDFSEASESEELTGNESGNLAESESGNLTSINSTMFLCTHLTVMSLPIPYLANSTSPNPEPYTSWFQENEGDVKTIVEVMQNYSSSIIMGDFNDGTNITSQNVSAVNPAAYNVIANFQYNSSLGFFTNKWRNPYVEEKLGCTACENNSVSPTAANAIYDQVWLTNDWRAKVIRVAREFDQWLTIKVYNDQEGKYECISSPLSDHYGISVYFGASINDSDFDFDLDNNNNYGLNLPCVISSANARASPPFWFLVPAICLGIFFLTYILTPIGLIMWASLITLFCSICCINK